MAEKIIIHEPTKSEFKRMAVQMGYAPVRYGEWVMDETTYAGVSVANYKCSECGETNGTWLRVLPTDKLPRFCRWCGAKMDGGANDG